MGEKTGKAYANINNSIIFTAAEGRILFKDYMANHAFHGDIKELKKILKEESIVHNYINKPTWLGDTPLVLTAYKGNAYAAKLLINKGADVKHTNHHNMNIFMIAAYYNHCDYLKKFDNRLEEMINNKSTDGKTALIYAAMNDSVDSVKFLLSKNADPLLEEDAGHRALWYAHSNNNHDLVQILMAKEGRVGK